MNSAVSHEVVTLYDQLDREIIKLWIYVVVVDEQTTIGTKAEHIVFDASLKIQSWTQIDGVRLGVFKLIMS